MFIVFFSSFIRIKYVYDVVVKFTFAISSVMSFLLVFSSLHGMPARTSYEKGVCPFVRLFVCQTRWLWLSRFLYHTKDHLASWPSFRHYFSVQWVQPILCSPRMPFLQPREGL